MKKAGRMVTLTMIIALLLNQACCSRPILHFSIYKVIEQSVTSKVHRLLLKTFLVAFSLYSLIAFPEMFL